MYIVCLDLEGVLVPEIWIEFSKATGITELKKTTRDEPDYDKLMKFRISLLNQKGLHLQDIKNIISGMDPLPGANAFLDTLRSLTQVVILSDTFSQFAQPLMAKLSFPTLLCNSLIVGNDDIILDYSLRQSDGKRKAVEAFRDMNLKVFAAGDSYNDLNMIKAAHAGALFCAPESIKKQNPDFPAFETYEQLLIQIKQFVSK